MTQPDTPDSDSTAPNTVSRRPSLVPGRAADRLGPRTQAGAGDNLRMLSELGAPPPHPVATARRLSPLWMALAGLAVLAGGLALWQAQLRESDVPTKPPPTFATPDTARARAAATGGVAPMAAAAPATPATAATATASAALITAQADPNRSGTDAASQPAQPARIENVQPAVVPSTTAKPATPVEPTAATAGVAGPSADVAAAPRAAVSPVVAAVVKPAPERAAAKPVAPRREPAAVATPRSAASPAAGAVPGAQPTVVAAAAPAAVLVERPAAPGAAADTAPLLTRSLKDVSAARNGVTGDAPAQAQATNAVAAAPAATPRSSAAAGKGKDADVELLAALVAHVANSNAGTSASRQPLGQQDQLTIAGIVRRCDALGGQEARECRRKICDGYWGKADACPAKLKAASKD